MTMSIEQHDTGFVSATVPPHVAKEPEASDECGHPLRRKGITFVTHEDQVKGPFGLPHWNEILERTGLKKPVKMD